METEMMQFITPIKPWEPLDSAGIPKAVQGQNQEVTLFKDVFQNVVNQVYDTQRDVEEKQYLLATGQLDDAHTLPIAEAKAALSLEMMITLRNKALEAYNELMKMSI